MQIDFSMKPELTAPLVYLRGEYALWNYKIPYFSTVMPLSFAMEKLSLIEDIPQFERMDWSIEELFQRDISWDRIDQDLVSYLRSENKPQFFNAITVALLPKEGFGFSAEYKEKTEYSAIDDPNLEEPLQIGGIQLQPYQGSYGSAGQIRWDPKEIRGVAVDGQHRLAAIKRLAGIVEPSKLDSSSVPVICIVPDERLGFVSPETAEETSSVVSPLRRIFIDLNKNARPVSRTRNILLDDQDLNSVCTRRVIGSKLTSDVEPNRIPLPLIDWASETNKFETGPFISTVLLQYDIVSKCLKVPDLELESEDDQRISNWLNQTFSPDEETLERLMTQANRCYNQEVPLHFLPDEIKYLGDRFEELWSPFIKRIFSEIGPYKNLWSYEEECNLLRPEFVNLYIASEVKESEKEEQEVVNAIRMYEPEWSKDKGYNEPLTYINTQIKKDSWAFKVVFQKALFYSYFDLLKQYPYFVEKGEDPKSEFTDKFVEAVNFLLSSGFEKVEYKFGSPKVNFWRGIGLRADDSIDYTKAGSNRLLRWLNAWVCMYHSEEVPSFGNLETSSGINSLIWNSLKVQPVYQSFEKIAIAQNEEMTDEQIEEEAKNLRKKRYDHLRKLAQNS